MDKLKKGEIDWIDMDEIEKKCLESTKKIWWGSSYDL